MCMNVFVCVCVCTFECMDICMRVLCMYEYVYLCMCVYMDVALEEHFRTTSLAFLLETNMPFGMDFRVDIRDIRITHCATLLINIFVNTVCFLCLNC